MLLLVSAESLGHQCSELEDPISFPQLPPFPAVMIYLLYPHHPQIFIGVGWLVEVCGHRFVQFLRCDVGPVAIHPDVQGIFCLSHIMLVTLVTADHVHVNWFLMVYLLPVVLLVKVLVRFISWQVLHRLLPQGALSPRVGGVGVFTSARTRSRRLGGLL